MMRLPGKYFLALALQCFLASAVLFGLDVATAHSGPVTALVIDNNLVFSAGDDGYIVVWDIENRQIIDSYQVSPYSITAVALRPGKSELVVAESDGFGLHRVSAWNYLTKSRLFSLRFKDAVNFLTYSAAGSFIIVGRNAPNGVVILEPATGSSLLSPVDATGSIRFAATGMSERTMITYSVAGELSYWDMTNGSRIRLLTVAANLYSPTLFGSNRFFAGYSGDSLVIYDAVSGKELNRKTLSSTGIILKLSDEATSILCLSELGTLITMSQFDADVNKPTLTYYAVLPSDFAGKALLFDDQVLFALTSGTIAQAQLGAFQAQPYESASRLKYQEAAIIGNSILLATENLSLKLPADPSQFIDSGSFYSQASDAKYNYTSNNDFYIKWLKDGSAMPTLVRSYFSYPLPLSLNTPVITVKLFANLAVFVDSFGRLTVYDTDLYKTVYSFSSLGLIDVDFVDNKKIIVAKDSTLPPYAPLIIIDIETGETAPMDIQGKTAFRIYRGSSNYLYAALVDDRNGSSITSIVKINPEPPYFSEVLLTYQAVDLNTQLVEAGDSLATTLGGDGISVIYQNTFINLSRSAGLPKRLLAFGAYFIVLDNNGNLFWYDSQNGELAFSLYLVDKDWYLLGDNIKLSGSIIHQP